MINDDPKEFIEGLHYGDEHYSVYDGRKYFIQGYNTEDGKPALQIYGLDPDNFDYLWTVVSDDKKFPVAEFESAPIFNGKTFWEAEKDIEWVDE